jgi:hypothetical protein
MNKKESFSDNTYSLAKGMHHINLAKMYFEDVRYGTKGDIKAIFQQYIQKCEWIMDNLKHRLTEENRKNLQAELNDSLSFEAINDKLIRLDNQQRFFLESIIDSLIKGEEIKIVEN